MLRYSSTSQPPVRPKRIRFGLLSAEEIEEMSVCSVTETTLYYRGLPATGGLLDPLMGTVDRRHLCATCMNDPLTCQGHPGHIRLAFPVYHIGFVDTVLKVLRSVCFCCSRLSMTEDEIATSNSSLSDTSGRTRLNAVHQMVRMRKTCPHCGMTRPNIVRTSLGLRVDWPSDMTWESPEEETFCKATFTARDALSILRNISNEDLEVMGFDPQNSHPQHMIVRNLVVCPPCTRPAVYSSEGSRSRGQNDLTMRYLEILKRSNDMAAGMHEVPWEDVMITQDLMDRLNRLQYEVYMMVNNSARVAKPPGMGRNSSNANGKSIQERLKGKEGRVRGNLMGKRVDFSARCVITPDANFECDRVGVPHRIAMNLTIPEQVNSNNILALKKRVENGASHIHGAQNVIHTDGTVTNIGSCRDRSTISLRVGDIVERFIADDDVVVFNRQPSLHMHGMQAHRVRLMKGHTFRLSLVVASPYNADFDGDEMNLHVPQSKAAATECAMLMGVAQNCIGAQSNKPVMGIVQDSLLGLHRMSAGDVILDHAHACRIIGRMRHNPRTLPRPAVVIHPGAGGQKQCFWTGKQLISQLIDPVVYIEMDHDLPGNPRNASDWSDDLPVVVMKGTIVSGILRKAHVGTGAGGIVDTITRELGGVAAMRFMGDAQRITHEFLLQRGHHVGIDDVMLSSDGHKRVTERLDKATRLCEEIQREMTAGDMSENHRHMGEGAILRILSKTLLQTGSIVNEYMKDTNAIKRMVGAGSKGTFINMSQICAALGQQSLEGSRIVAEKGTRTLPCFPHNDVTLASRGMVQNSFSLGLSPPELFFHAIGGREGLVDTAVKTSQSGYIQRRMNKSMEDNTVHSCGRLIRNSINEVVSFQWGSDGFHPARVERVKLTFLTVSVEDMVSAVHPRAVDIVKRARELCMQVKSHVLSGTDDGIDARVLLPFNPVRIRRRIQRELSAEETHITEEVTAELLAFLADMPQVVRLSLLDLFRPDHIRRLPMTSFRSIFETIRYRIQHALSIAGESVGCIAAQSIGEPCTQLTLNSVDYTTHMAIRWTGTDAPPPVSCDGEVGAFIDALMDAHPQDIQWQPDGKTAYLPLPPGTALALSPDINGVMKWTELEAVTRHPPINKDGSNTLIRVTTESGHEVVVTKGKSLLVERNGKLVETDAARVGDLVPIVANLPTDARCTSLDLRTIFAATEVIFTDNVINFVDKRKNTPWGHGYWTLHNLAQTLPFSRSDAVLESVRKQPQLLSTPGMVTTTSGSVNPSATKTKAMIPCVIPLDRAFGFFLGAYLSEGCLTDHQVHISNVDDDFRVAAREWPERHGIGWHETLPQHQNKNNGTTISVMFHNTLLVWLLKRTCGSTSYGKRVPGFAFAAPDDFVEGLLDGYISGDGCISQKQCEMSAGSRSRSLRDGISLLLSRYGISTTLRESMHLNRIKWTTEEDGRRTQEPHGVSTPFYTLRVGSEGTRLFAKRVRLTLAYKQKRLKGLLLSDSREKRTKVQNVMRDVFLSEISSITEQESTRESVYDLTVAETRNMTAVNGLGCRDTFHNAGNAAKNVTLGIPRFKELLDATKSPKTPCTTIRFHAPYNTSETFAEYMANTMPMTRLGDVVQRCDIVHDPDPSSTTIPEDEWIVLADSMLGYEMPSHATAYVVRIVLNQDVMRMRHMTPTIVRRILSERLATRAHVSSSEVNAVDWVIRIRFFHVRDMLATGNIPMDQEALICHRALNVLLETVLVCGHHAITGASIGFAQGEHLIHAYGNVLMDCCAADSVDWTRCTSNDVWEVLNTLGIEACAHVLFEQMKSVVSFDGTYVDDRHILMIVDSICRGGSIMPLNRHGINRTETSPLMRCSFEETTDILCEAAGFAQAENARGVSTCIMTGQTPHMGTGTVDVLFPVQSERLTVEQCKPQGRVMRSTCRSYVKNMVEENLEYVMDPQRPTTLRPLSPPTLEGSTTRKRARFRMASPDRKR